MKTGREYRAMAQVLASPVEERARLIESDHYVEGYATTFDRPYTLWGEWREQVARHAFDGADLSDVIVQYDHEGRVLARTRNATLVMRADDHGMLCGVDLSKGESARQLHEEIDNGLVDRMSFAFVVEEEDIDYDAKLRTILRIKKVYDVSAVSIPANDTTSIAARGDAPALLSARAFIDGAIEERSRIERERRRKKLDMTIAAIGAKR